MTTPTEAPREALPEPLKVVAYCYYDGERENFPSGPHATLYRSVVITVGRQPHCRNETPLVRLTDAQSALESERQAHAAEVERLRGMLVWAMDNMGMRDTGTEFVAHVLRRGGTGDYDDCATFIDQAIARGKT